MSAHLSEKEQEFKIASLKCLELKNSLPLLKGRNVKSEDNHTRIKLSYRKANQTSLDYVELTPQLEQKSLPKTRTMILGSRRMSDSKNADENYQLKLSGFHRHKMSHPP